jgi:hypothetical protein
MPVIGEAYTTNIWQNGTRADRLERNEETIWEAPPQAWRYPLGLFAGGENVSRHVTSNCTFVAHGRFGSYGVVAGTAHRIV